MPLGHRTCRQAGRSARHGWRHVIEWNALSRLNPATVSCVVQALAGFFNVQEIELSSVLSGSRSRTCSGMYETFFEYR